MANTITYNEQKYSVGDTIAVDYKIKDGEKFRIQQFAGILLKVKGDTENNRMVTVRKMSKAGIGVERIFPLASPFIDAISLVKKTNNTRAKVYYVRDLSDKKLRRKLYHKVNDHKRALHIKNSAVKKTEDVPAEEVTE
jgi:large subunit ribosomal protein L19